jgi:hypothetical protein
MLQYREQTAVYLDATGESCLDCLIEFYEHGERAHALAHSHPGWGEDAIWESPTDVRFLGPVQEKARADMIGLIVSRPDQKGLAYIHFWTVCVPFEMHIFGNGLKVVDRRHHVYAIEV